ncbi:phage tail tube protein [Thalassospira sp. MCCC 1A01428]|uniref:phage tail tube protein n=1 Tax=Thalassospira sp. MCCC 1A01428 TaxID=1470575 RepID=UPI000A1FB07A|nr:phage tail tube protein [Thalassospira sp. MCCC 1A01428]OSQ39206.1 hypothetical protein THS27_21115 [Thalassospira sp. MCCC 1A01428]
MPTLAGVQTLSVNGAAFAVAETASYNIGGKTRENIAGGGKGSVGFSQKGRAAFIEVEVFLGEGQKSSDLDVHAGEIKLECADRTIILSPGSYVGDLNVDASKNSLTARFEGSSAREVS